ncbi:sensor domain-containing diguanylate cyclase [Thiomicrorhabdus sp. ZW0627]|uniref:sensor domain-containing diguanylate cyclase n=1 Tax=Thiomicrorhabdus sp. ZW0627 TaxID=3039774 RepID=UPI002436DA06|nr:sensor domain-containing diguanylate cyclase [Thiomicrorhabdus sp. ZW0627]MDG6773237.1 sensor domain-containing diguanylate cyclase [Thiomicrorhabdus sp. ZW0627]
MEPFDDYKMIVDRNVITSATDLHGTILYASEAFCRISGYSKQELIGQSHNIVRHPDMPSSIYRDLWKTISRGEVWRGELKNRHKSGSSYWVEVEIFPNYDLLGQNVVGYTAIRRDITDRKRAEALSQTVELSEKKLDEYLDLIDENVITSSTDPYGTITSVSRAFCEISGFSREELIGRNHNVVRHPDMPKSLYKDLWRTISRGKVWRGEIKNRKKDDGFYWVDVTIKPEHDETGGVSGYTAVRHDITDRKKIEQLIITDELTGVFNRRYYNQVLMSEVNRAKRHGEWLGFLMVDADNFKKYNDGYGHHAGDGALQAIADTLKQVFQRNGDYVFRLGGEEFGVLFASESHGGFAHLAEKARQAVFDLKMEHDGNEPYGCVTVSIGLFIMDPRLTHLDEDILKCADRALYLAKENGRNRIEIHTII